MFSKIRRYHKTCSNCSESPLPPQNLSVTPSEIQALTERGVAASSSNSGLIFSEGSANPVLTVDMMRGVDAAEVWNASKDAQANLVKAHKKDKEFYG